MVGGISGIEIGKERGVSKYLIRRVLECFSVTSKFPSSSEQAKLRIEYFKIHIKQTFRTLVQGMATLLGREKGRH